MSSNVSEARMTDFPPKALVKLIGVLLLSVVNEQSGHTDFPKQFKVLAMLFQTNLGINDIKIKMLAHN